MKTRTSKLKSKPALLKSSGRTRGGKGDLFFLAAVILLAAFGVVAVYSASSYNAEVQYELEGKGTAIKEDIAMVLQRAVEKTAGSTLCELPLCE